MAIKIETIVGIDSRPLLKINSSSRSKKSGVFYPDSLELKVIHFTEYQNSDGDVVDAEMSYIIEIPGTASAPDIVSDSVRELNSFLRSYDYKKFPLQFQTDLFEQGSFYANEVKQFVSDRFTKRSKSKLNSKELLSKLKK